MENIIIIYLACLFSNKVLGTTSLMLYGDTSRVGVPYSKDPHVVNFQGRYLMYHSIPPMKGEPDSGWNIGIAESKDLMNWTKVGEITPAPKLIMRRKDFVHPVRW